MVHQVFRSKRYWYTFELSAEQRKRKEGRDKNMAHMRRQIDLLTKHIVSKFEKVTFVWQPHRYEDQDIDLEKEANFWATMEVSKVITQATKVTILEINAGHKYSREGQYYRTSKRESIKTGWREMGTEMIEVVSMCLHAIETAQVILPVGLSWKTCCPKCDKKLNQLMQGWRSWKVVLLLWFNC